MTLSPELIGTWIAAFLTLAIFSYLYDDNPFYKAAEHLYVGISAGFLASLAFWQQLQPNMFGRFWPKLDPDIEMTTIMKGWYFIYDLISFIISGFGIMERGIFPKGGIAGFKEIEIIYVVPFILGLFMLLRLVPNLGWLARWAIAYIVGMAGGLRFYSFLNSDVLEQIKSLLDHEMKLRPGLKTELKVKNSLPAVILDTNHPLVSIAVDVAQRATGRKWNAVGAGPANEGYMLINAGIPTFCGFGPTGDNAHAANEWIEINSLTNTVAMYAAIAENYLGDLQRSNNI